MNKVISSALLVLSLTAALHAQSEFAPQALLKPKFTGLYSIPPNLDARAGYDTLGARAGINIIFAPGFKPETVIPLRVEGQTFFEAMDPHLSRGVYVNVLDSDEDTDRVKAAYGENYERLVALKRQYDPDNLFRMNHNIRP